MITEKKRLRPKKSEVMRLLADNRKAYKLMNWKPRYASFKNFKKAIKITIEWTKKNKSKNHLQSKEYVI